MILASHGIIGSQIVQFSGLLDTYTGAAAAYSLRKLRSGYTGYAIKVRRASDNTEQDIGFSNNELDTTTLTSFCSGTDGFVTTWYDQSGNGRNATQATAANQPQIVSSGSVITENSKSAIDWSATKKLSLSTNLVLNTQTYFAVVGLNNNITSSTTSNFLTSGATQGSQVLNLWGFGSVTGSLTNERFVNVSVYSTLVYGLGQVTSDITQGQYVFNFKYESPSTSQLYQNNTLQSTTNTGGNGGGGGYTSAIYPNSFTNIGNNTGLSNGLDGKYQELIIYPSNENINNINTNINNFYSIY